MNDAVIPLLVVGTTLLDSSRGSALSRIVYPGEIGLEMMLLRFPAQWCKRDNIEESTTDS